MSEGIDTNWTKYELDKMHLVIHAIFAQESHMETHACMIENDMVVGGGYFFTP